MIHYEREVYKPEFIEAMLKEMNIVTMSMHDEDGYPYAVPISYGFEMDEKELTVYIHFMKKGKKVDLLKKNPHVCLTFSMFNDFPDKKYKGHYHDYRSVIAKGMIEILDYKDNPEIWEKGYNLLYTCNNRAIKPLSERNVIPAMYIGVIHCPMDLVSAKSEFPIRSVEDVPFKDIYALEDDETPFDLTDIIAAAKERMANKK